jgi:hypothetical protein
VGDDANEREAIEPRLRDKFDRCPPERVRDSKGKLFMREELAITHVHDALSRVDDELRPLPVAEALIDGADEFAEARLRTVDGPTGGGKTAGTTTPNPEAAIGATASR